MDWSTDLTSVNGATSSVGDSDRAIRTLVMSNKLKPASGINFDSNPAAVPKKSN
jgi:hypothetical protein